MKRVNDALLTRAEKLILDWVCRRMPRWVTSDVLTALGVAGAGLCFIGYALSDQSLSWLWLAILGMVVNWAGDSLDGSLARFRQAERPRYGFFLDHMTDTLAMALIMIGIGLSPFVHFAAALGALAAYYLVTILTMATCLATGIFRISFNGLGPTEIRIIIAVSTIGAIILPSPLYNLAGTILQVYDFIIIGVTLLLVFISIFSTLKTAKMLAKEDPLPLRSNG